MESIVKRMLASEVPVVVWVGPSGARAASAGFVILLAADVAAMAPGTRAGAASTVYAGGESRDGDVSLKKSNEDVAALVRSIAERRGRNVQAAEEAVFAAKAYAERPALEMGLVDLVAGSQDELLRVLDERAVTRFDGTTVALRTAGATFATSQFPWWHGVLEILGHPAVAYLLLMAGLLGLYVEFTQPGVVFPGVAGALCLILFAFAGQVLPISAVGILLVLLALVMFLLEIKVVSHGLLTIGGAASLLLGSLLLVDGPIPELRVPRMLVLPTSLTIAALCAIALRLTVRAQRGPVQTGVERLVQEVGTVTHELHPQGKVFVHGEIWDAASDAGDIPRGARVRILRVDGLRLVVAPAEPAGAGGA
jgi:membrane-bound serine protease (ClpP class)